MKNRIKELMATVLEINIEEINNDTSPETIENWDSLRHMNLITILEEEYNIRLNGNQIAEMVNLERVINIVEKLKNT